MGTMLNIFATGLTESWFENKFDMHYSSLLANFYPRQEQPPLPGQLRRGAHADYGAFTLLYQDDAPGGLEILDEDRGWLPVPHVSGTFVLNIGRASTTTAPSASFCRNVDRPRRSMLGTVSYLRGPRRVSSGRRAK